MASDKYAQRPESRAHPRKCETPAVPSRPLVAVVGPTATGKSDLGVAVAIALGGEVINADSMQLYRGMDVGTAKLTLEERHGVPHHLLDVLDVSETATVADFKGLAHDARDDCWARLRQPVLVGGSGLYVRAVIDDLEFPATDPEIRAALEDDLARNGTWMMHQRLRALDPAAADAIPSANGRRVVRALEVITITGEPYTAQLPAYARDDNVVLIGLAIDTPTLRERIESRVNTMWERGLVDEVRRLGAVGLREGQTARRALGYQQVLAYLDGECSEDDARAETVAATRRFARRQRSWFRPDPRIQWLPHDAPDLLDQALNAVGRAGAVR